MVGAWVSLCGSKMFQICNPLNYPSKSLLIYHNCPYQHELRAHRHIRTKANPIIYIPLYPIMSYYIIGICHMFVIFCHHCGRFKGSITEDSPPGFWGNTNHSKEPRRTIWCSCCKLRCAVHGLFDAQLSHMTSIHQGTQRERKRWCNEREIPADINYWIAS